MIARKHLCACLLNVSEAKNNEIIHNIIKSALKINSELDRSCHRDAGDTDCYKKIVTSVLNVFSDKDYNRSVITIVSYSDYLAKSVINSCVTANELINLNNQIGGHPRLGAVDLVPIHPLSAEVSLDECGKIATEIARGISSKVDGTSSFLFGHADVPLNRGLVDRRKEMKWYSGQYGQTMTNILPDIGGAINSRYGLTGIGAIPYMMNCNVTIQTNDLDIGREISADIRATSPSGFPGVQSMAFHHDGNIEIACNIAGIYIDDRENVISKAVENKYKNAMAMINTKDRPLLCSFHKYFHVSPSSIEDKISHLASKHEIKTIGCATIIGFTPDEALNIANYALDNNIADFWKTRLKISM